MPLGLWNQEWLSVNGQRKYPLADDAGGIDDSGIFTLPNDFIVELDLAVHAGMDVAPAQFFVKHVGAYATGYSVVVGYQPTGGGDAVDVATALIARQTHTRDRAYALGGIEPFTDTVGKIVIGRLDSIDEQPPGFHTFSLDNSRLDPDAVRPIIRGISSITVVNSGQRSQKLYGDIEFVAGSNMQFVPILEVGQNPKIKFNAVRGEGTVDDCVCVGDDATAPPIKFIDGVGPTPTGDFNIIGDKCLDVAPITNGIKISDTCSKPCCGCAELETITRDLERLKSEAESVRTFNANLRNAVDTMALTVLGSRLSDRGCVVCE